MRKSPKRCISQSISQVFTSPSFSRCDGPLFMGTRVVDSRKQNKEKKRHASPAGIKKDRKKQTPLSLVWKRRRMQRFESQKLAKSNKVRAKRPKEKRAGINATARVSRTPRQSNGDVSRTEKKKESRWSTPEDAKVGGAQLVRGHAPCER